MIHSRCTTTFTSIRYLLVTLQLLFLTIGFGFVGTIVEAKKSIPRSYNHHHRLLSPDEQQQQDNDEYYHQLWIPSPKINPQTGFLKDLYTRTPGQWEVDANIGGKYGPYSSHTKDGLEHVPVIIRQVPGDGNCLFHSLSVSLSFVEEGCHLDFTTTRNGSSNNSRSSSSRNNGSGGGSSGLISGTVGSISSSSSSSGDDDDQTQQQYDYTQLIRRRRRIRKTRWTGMTLRQRSAILRQEAANVLAGSISHQEDDDDEEENQMNAMNNKSRIRGGGADNDNDNNRHRRRRRKNRHRRRRKDQLLFLQGREYLRASELLNVAASQYDITGEEYCKSMRKDGYWGGGPEIVALCNVLKRPIHVYELISVVRYDTSNNNNDGEDDDEDGDVDDDRTTSQRKETRRWRDKGSSSTSEDNDMNPSTITTTTSSKITTKLSSFLPWKTHSKQGHYYHHHHHRYSKKKRKNKPKPEFRLRRMACFGSPRFDHREPLEILSADCRFPDLNPGQQSATGNHFLALFPADGRYASSSTSMNGSSNTGGSSGTHNDYLEKKKKKKEMEMRKKTLKQQTKHIKRHQNGEMTKNEGGKQTTAIEKRKLRNRIWRKEPPPLSSSSSSSNVKKHVTRGIRKHHVRNNISITTRPFTLSTLAVVPIWSQLRSKFNQLSSWRMKEL